MNNNLTVAPFRQQLLQHLKQLDKPQQVTLANTKDTVLPREHHGSGSTPLILTCYDGFIDMVQWLLHNDVDVDQCRDDGVTGLKDGWSPLNTASDKGHTDIVKLLLEKNPNVDLCNKDGWSPLNTASKRGDTNIVKLLLEKDANVDLCNNDGLSPLNTASDKRTYCNSTVTASSNVRDYISELSVGYGFDVVVSSSPLHIACFMGRTDIVHCLLNYHVNINITKEDGATPLFYAWEVGHEDIVRLLLDKEADTQICRLDGRSPLNIATDNGHSSIVKMLTEHIKKGDTLSS
ncbi:unnamed protein product [Mytilus edulis]|uniref:Uncharacterized protein n=2 Tax=Mytilus edulis TaxID=6550 RepID=A0A8S3UIG3_MYTED|nr:unnamed protein product [Mytilus edulis]